jgi:hypothetical protein
LFTIRPAQILNVFDLWTSGAISCGHGAAAAPGLNETPATDESEGSWQKSIGLSSRRHAEEAADRGATGPELINGMPGRYRRNELMKSTKARSGAGRWRRLG